jgi:hypothetical protein
VLFLSSLLAPPICHHLCNRPNSASVFYSHPPPPPLPFTSPPASPRHHPFLAGCSMGSMWMRWPSRWRPPSRPRHPSS